MLQRPTKLQERDTCLALAFLLLLIWFFSRRPEWVYAAGAMLLLGMAIPAAMRPLAMLWFGLAETLGKVVSGVLLTAVYMLILLPVALARRLMGKDTLKLRRWRSGGESCYVSRCHAYTADDLTKPY